MHMLGYIVKSSAAEMEVRIMEWQDKVFNKRPYGRTHWAREPKTFLALYFVFSGILEGQLLPHSGRAISASVRAESGGQLRGHAPGQWGEEWRGGIMLDIFPDDCQPLLCWWRGPHLPGLGRLPAQGGRGPHWQQTAQTVSQSCIDLFTHFTPYYYFDVFTP